MYDEILFSIIDYMNEIEKASFWNKELFEQQVYSIWAAKEIYILLYENEDEHPAQVVERYAKKMDEYSCRHGEKSIMFSIAHDTAIEILGIIHKAM